MEGDGGAFDVAVVGGGITGAAAARDAALRGLAAILLEKGDFASGTTSRTSRLIHGGLRYLEGFHVGLVAESLRERDRLARRLPHLLTSVPILVPVYREDSRGMGTVRIGIRLYDLLARRKRTPRYGVVPPAVALSLVPGLREKGLRGGAVFYDYQVLVPERLVVENLLSAAAPGTPAGVAAVVRNHSEVVAAAFEDGMWRLRVHDRIAGTAETVSAAAVINATGPWADRTRRLAGFGGEFLHPTKGAHIVLPGSAPHALFAASARDDRMFFILPFAGRVLVGTTDTFFGDDPDGAAASREDVAYLFESARAVLPGSPLFRSPPLYAFAGVRPLLKGTGATESRIPRSHRVFQEGPGGRFVTIAGGKLTTFRKMAEDAVDAAGAALGRRAPCRTAEVPYPGEIGGGAEGVEERIAALAATFRAPRPLCAHLVALYGSRAGRVLETAAADPSLARPLAAGHPDIAAEAVLAARDEWARFPEDAVLRRMRLGIAADRVAEALPAVAALPGFSGRAGRGS